MNDDFLHNHRKPLPPGFEDALRQRLRLEDEKTMTTTDTIRPLVTMDGYHLPTAPDHPAPRRTWLTLATTLAAVLALIVVTAITRTPPGGDMLQEVLPPLQALDGENITQLDQLAVIGKGALHQALWSPDGNTLALAGVRGVWLHDANDLDAPARLLEGDALPRPLKTAAPVARPRRSIAYSPDGTLLAMTNGMSVRVWNPVSGAVVADLEYPAVVTSVAFSPDGTRLAAGGGSWREPVDARLPVLVWDTITWMVVSELPTSLRQVGIFNLHFLPDSAHLAVHYAAIADGVRAPRDIIIWDVAEEHQEWTLDAGGVNVGLDAGFALSPDQMQLYFILDQRIASIDIEKRELLQTGVTVSMSNTYPQSLAIHPDGTRIAIASLNNGLQIRALDGTSPLPLTSPEQGSPVVVNSVAYSPDGTRLVSIAYDSIVQVWDSETGEELHILRDYNSAISHVRLLPDGQRLFVVDRSGALRIYDVNSGAELQRFQGARSLWGRHADSTPDGRLLSYLDVELDDVHSPNTGIHILDGATGSPISVIAEMRMPNDQIAFSPDGKRLVSYGYEGAQVWDLDQSAETGEGLYFSREGNIYAAAFSPAGRFVAYGSQDEAFTGLVIYDLDEPLQMLAPQPALVRVIITALAWSPDGRELVVAIDNTAISDGLNDTPYRVLRRFDVESMNWLDVAPLEEHVAEVAYSPDGSLIAVTQMPRAAVQIYDAVTLELLVSTPETDAAQVSFSPDGTLLLSGGEDGLVRVWGVPQ
ncbi:MAG: hypothetical protein JNJ61_15305 [Anaerolineae bacterium]|nr:hypothetical protein [Anaerolineae bacterium]